MKKLNLNAIRIDGGTQPRERINMEIVGDYAEAIKVGIDEFPPVVVFHDGAEHWLADGFHRWHAHKQAEKASILADVRQGSLSDAKLYASSAEANGTHGLRRSNADKRACVLMTLSVKPDWSDSHIAKHAGVSHPFVADVRRSILKPLQDAPSVRTVERAGKTYQQDTTRIGKSAKADPSVAAPREQPTSPPAVVKTAPTPAATTGDDAFGDIDPIKELESAQAEITKLTAEIEAAEANDLKAEAIKWRRSYEHAQRQQSEAMDRAKQATDREAWTMKQLRRCGKAVGEDDPKKIPAAVEAAVRRWKDAA